MSELLDIDLLLRARSEGLQVFDEGASKIGMLGKAVGLAGVAVAGAATLGVLEAVKLGTAFQQSLTLIHTQAGNAAANLNQLGDAILKMSPKVAQSPQALADALYHIESQAAGMHATFTVPAQLDMLQAAAKLATMGVANLEDTTQGLVGVMSAFPQYVGHASEAVGIMNSIVGAGDMRMQQFSAALQTGLLPAAANVHLTLKDAGAALATMTDNVTPAEEAATRLRMTFALLEKQSGPAADALKSIGIMPLQLGKDMLQPNGLLAAVTDLRTHLAKTFGPAALQEVSQYTEILKTKGSAAADQYAAHAAGAAKVVLEAFGGGKTSAAIETLLYEYDRFKSKYAAITDGAKGFAKAWEETTQTTKFQLTSAQDAFDAFETNLGTKLLPYVGDAAQLFSTRLLPALTDVVNWVSNTVVPAFITLGGYFEQHILPAITSTAGWINDHLVPAFRDVAGSIGGAIKTDLQFLGDHFWIVEGAAAALVGLKVADWVAGVGRSVGALANGGLLGKIKGMFPNLFPAPEVEVQGTKAGTTFGESFGNASVATAAGAGARYGAEFGAAAREAAGPMGVGGGPVGGGGGGGGTEGGARKPTPRAPSGQPSKAPMLPGWWATTAITGLLYDITNPPGTALNPGLFPTTDHNQTTGPAIPFLGPLVNFLKNPFGGLFPQAAAPPSPQQILNTKGNAQADALFKKGDIGGLQALAHGFETGPFQSMGLDVSKLVSRTQDLITNLRTTKASIDAAKKSTSDWAGEGHNATVAVAGTKDQAAQLGQHMSQNNKMANDMVPPLTGAAQQAQQLGQHMSATNQALNSVVPLTQTMQGTTQGIGDHMSIANQMASNMVPSTASIAGAAAGAASSMAQWGANLRAAYSPAASLAGELQIISGGIAGINFNLPKKATPGHAIGGSVGAGSTSIVGERGPELFTASAAGSIVANSVMNNYARMAVGPQAAFTGDRTLASLMQAAVYYLQHIATDNGSPRAAAATIQG